MTNDVLVDLKEQLNEVNVEIAHAKAQLIILERKANVLRGAISGYERDPLSTEIEYIFSRFDFRLSGKRCCKGIVGKAKNLLLRCGYTDLKQLEGTKLEDLMELCRGTQVLGVILAYCYKCNVEMNLESIDKSKKERINYAKGLAEIFKSFIVF